jgi:hypothetical protein
MAGVHGEPQFLSELPTDDEPGGTALSQRDRAHLGWKWGPSQVASSRGDEVCWVRRFMERKS